MILYSLWTVFFSVEARTMIASFSLENATKPTRKVESNKVSGPKEIYVKYKVYTYKGIFSGCFYSFDIPSSSEIMPKPMKAKSSKKERNVLTCT